MGQCVRLRSNSFGHFLARAMKGIGRALREMGLGDARVHFQEAAKKIARERPSASQARPKLIFSKGSLQQLLALQVLEKLHF